MEHLRVYRSFIKHLGILNGVKVVIMMIVSHIDHNKRVFYIKNSKTGDQKLYLRTHTSDIQLVRSMLIEEEYEFLNYNRYSNIVTNGKKFIDAGANIGMVSRIFLAINPELEGIAIEADKGNYDALRMNMKSYTANVKTVLGGLWNKNAYLRVFERNGGNSLSFIVREIDEKEVTSKDIKAVNAISCMGTDYIDIFKIDIEGSEYDVFDDSSEEWIDRVRMFIIEFHDRIKPGCEKRITNRLLSHGFIVDKYGDNHVFIKG